MKALFLTHQLETPSTRYRVTHLLPRLRASGITCTTREIRSGVIDRLGMLRTAGKYDVVVVQKRLFPTLVLKALRARAKRLVFDFDDSVHVGTKGESRTRMSRFAAMVKAADVTIAGNDYLRDAATVAGARRVEVLPTALDPSRYAMHEHRDGIILAWIGGGGNVAYLESILSALPRGLTLRVISNRFPASTTLEIEKRPWSEETETADLAGADIGLAPLPDDSWTRGKCGFKILQYMAAGLPVVASPVGVQARIVEPGRTGILASGSAEWTKAVNELTSDPLKRRRLGAAGREKVERQYSLDVVGTRFAHLLKELVSPQGR